MALPHAELGEKLTWKLVDAAPPAQGTQLLDAAFILLKHTDHTPRVNSQQLTSGNLEAVVAQQGRLQGDAARGQERGARACVGQGVG
jgi:hypothetical protein